ncbi:MAG: TIR domain-containing protein [Ruminococcus sp.]|nr:TIR domain-containing protein [Ruminococcus sp.]
MAIFKCKMCGGDLEINGASTVAQCIYCGTQQTVPTVKDETLQGLFNRANVLRMKSEFDKAEQLYEKIVQMDNTQSEAYWGLILSKYGIEYVEDPATLKHVPTCHRTSLDSIIADEDYKSALQYADATQRSFYETEAKEIDRLQKEIIALSQKEEPYDVFICYKETDASGKRTQDSVIANDIYYQLTQQGFKVFYAAITLEDKLGSAYEPCIFAALNSAKVMLSIGTRPEYFNAVWVKNEWSRFLKMMKKDRSKLLIPCYRDMDAYELPEEFAHLQAQDMVKIGFINDIVRGISKVLSVNAPKETKTEPVVVNTNSSNTAPLLKRAFMFLEDGDWSSANEYCEKVLDLDPECAEAYLGKLMADLKVKKQGNLKDCTDPFDKNNNYQKAYRFGDNKLKDKLKADVDYINERNENTRKYNALKDAKAKIAKNDLNQCKSALVLLESLKGFKDANEQIEKCKEKIKELEAKAEKHKKKTMTIAVSVLSAVIVVIAFIVLLTSFIIPNGDYKKAVALMEDGKSEEAIAILEQLDGFKDSEEKILSIRYADAVSLKEEGKTDEAIAAFEDLGDYEDSAEQIQELNFSKNMEKCKSADVDSYVKFGTYEQDNNESNGKEDIEWRVLEKKDNKILVVSKYALDFKPYNDIRIYSTWTDCSLRTWMNDDFFNTAFSDKEQAVIPTVTVPAHNSYMYMSKGKVSESTKDKVFILSTQELDKYFGVVDLDFGWKAREISWEPTDYTKTKGTSSTNGSWLRTSTLENIDADYIYEDGHIDYENIDHLNYVCPAMWIELK